MPEELPPLPRPTRLCYKQRLCSVGTVVCTAAGGQLLIRGLSRLMGDDAAWNLMLRLADGHTSVAAIALLLINVWDPGIVIRHDERGLPNNSLPPPVVVGRLRAGEPLDGLSNQPDEHGVATFCVRCCVWRPVGSHHCSVCNRCVEEFDEHCEILGCCVGGSVRACRGNKLIHRLNIWNLILASVTAAAALLVAAVKLSLRDVANGALFIFMVLWPATAILVGVARRRNWRLWLWSLISGQRLGPRAHGYARVSTSARAV